MPRPCKARRLETLPRAVLYEPLNYDLEELEPREIAIEDFEVVRLVDGYGLHIGQAAKAIGVSRSTAGRMLERCRRAIALGIERRAPLYLDASENLELDTEGRTGAPWQEGELAIAVMSPDLDSPVSRLFGRAEHFCIFNGMIDDYRCIENPGTKASRSAARKAVSALKKQGVKRVVAGRFGADALEALGTAKIESYLASGLTVRRAYELYSNKEK